MPSRVGGGSFVACGVCVGRVAHHWWVASDWHPLLLLTETSPGVWTMKHAIEYRPFGMIEIRRTEAGPRYRVTFKGEVIGWATSLRVASERLWRAYLEDGRSARSGPPNVRGD